MKLQYVVVGLAALFFASQAFAQNSPPPKYSHTHDTGGISSEDTGSQKTGCAAATFANIAGDLSLSKENEDGCCEEISTDEIIDHFSGVTDFNGGVAKLQELLKEACDCYKYTIVIKRVTDWPTPPTTGSKPNVEVNENVTTKTYEPYNFTEKDIAEAMEAIGASDGGGIGLGGVHYTSGNPPRWDAAHMVTPTGVNTKPNDNGHNNLGFHDPYSDSSTDSSIAKGPGGRTYFSLWGQWFHAEELIYVTQEVDCDDAQDNGSTPGGNVDADSQGEYTPQDTEQCCCLFEEPTTVTKPTKLTVFSPVQHLRLIRRVFSAHNKGLAYE